MNVIGSFRFDCRMLPVLPFLLVGGFAIVLAAIPVFVLGRSHVATPLAAVFSARD
jgi:hypothetical protein